MLPLFTLYNVAQCPDKNGWWDEGPIPGCTNAIGDPRPAGGNNDCAFYVMWAMLRYLGVKLEATNHLVCIIPILFISVNSTK